MVLAAGYVAWQRSGTPPGSAPPVDAVPAPAIQVDLEPALVGIENRLADLETRLRRLEGVKNPPPALAVANPDIDDLRQRLESVEAQLRRIPDAPGAVKYSSAFPSEDNTLTPEEENQARLDSLQEAFANDDNADPALQAELENAAPLFDAEAVTGFEFRQANCRANYCLLEYEDRTANGAEAVIAENELYLLLAEKYGQGITIKGGEHRGKVRVIYIEFPAR